MSETSTAIQIRPAVPVDVPAIFRMIQELADFERLSSEVTATEEQLTEHLFGAPCYAEVLIATVSEQPVGFALFFHNYSTFLAKPGIYLEDLYVREAWRSRGVGSALLQAVRQQAISRGCGRYEWSVLNWNRHAIDFYEKMGAKPMSEWTIYRLTGEDLEREVC